MSAPDESIDLPTVVRQRASRGLLAYGIVLAIGLVLAGMAAGTAPRPLAVALAVTLITAASWFVRPIVGLCATVFFALIGDVSNIGWYPFTKGMSSPESIMFINRKLIVSPLEICLVAGIVALLVRYLVYGDWPFHLGRAGRALLAFEAFVFVGLVTGIGRGGDRHVALFQVRPFVALAMVHFLTIGVCRSRSDYRHVLWAIVGAVEVHAVISLLYIRNLPPTRLANSEGLVDHPAVMRMNVLFVLLISVWLFKGSSALLRTVLTMLSIPVAVVYMLAERRAAIIALVLAFAVMCVVLFWRQRRTFLRIVPVAAVLGLGYVGAFWNSQSSAGFPAQALKSVIAPTQVTSRNQSSDLYRTYENFDLNFTIRSNKVLGLGLGQPFYRPIQLPNLAASFALNAYIPHNSVLWVWVSFGFGGFVALFYLLGRTVQLGASLIKDSAKGVDLTVVLAFVLYVMMFTIFAAVDIAWDAGDLVVLGVAVAAAANYPALAADDTAADQASDLVAVPA